MTPQRIEILWILEKTEDEKFPYRLKIKKGEEILLCLRVQDKWPGQKGNIFCLREYPENYEKEYEEIERVSVKSFKRIGRKIAIVLDRSKNKRCDFIFLKKKYKRKEGEYEQIFWRTEKLIREKPIRVRISTYLKEPLSVVIDTNERYPWRFSDSKIMRKKLPIGDYALFKDDKMLAVIERKTFEDIIREFDKLPAFHQKLTELESYQNSALVIEVNYSDFLNPKKLKYTSSEFTKKAVAEIFAFHPSLKIVFAGTRKMANEWAIKYFRSIKSHERDFEFVKDIMEKYSITPVPRKTIFKIRKTLEEIVSFTKKELGKNFRALILYGSWAKGTAKEDSDIDLLLILSKKEKDIFDKKLKVIEKIEERWRISLSVALYDDFIEEKIPLYTAVKREGFVIEGEVDMRVDERHPSIKYKKFFKSSEEFEKDKIRAAKELYKKGLYSGVFDLCFISAKHAIQAYLAMKGKGFTSKVKTLLYFAEKYIDKKIKESFEELFELYVEFEYRMKLPDKKSTERAIELSNKIMEIYSRI